MNNYFPGWLISRYSGDAWLERFRELKEFNASTGRLPKKEECKIGSWLASQRCAARGTGKRLPLSEEQLQLMESEFPGWLIPTRKLRSDA